MAFNGTLLKIGSYTFPLKYIEYNSFNPVLNTQDIGSERMTSGKLDRTALEHKVPTLDFNVLDGLTNKHIDVIMSNIRSNYIDKNEKSFNATIYIPEIGDYITQKCYLDPSMKFPIKEIDAKNNIIVYDTITFSIVGY